MGALGYIGRASTRQHKKFHNRRSAVGLYVGQNQDPVGGDGTPEQIFLSA